MTAHSKQAEESPARGLGALLSESSLTGAFARVWALAAIVFVASGMFFLLMTGVWKMLLPLAGLAIGLGVIGSIQVLAKIDVQRRSGG